MTFKFKTMPYTRQQLANEYIELLNEILQDPFKLDVAARSVALVKIHGEGAPISAIEGAFDENGHVIEAYCKANGIVIQEDRLRMTEYGNQIADLPLKQRIVLSAAFRFAEFQLKEKYHVYHAHLNDQIQALNNQDIDPKEKQKRIAALEAESEALMTEIYELPKQIIKAWGKYNYVNLDSNMKPTPDFQAALQRGAFNFPQTNIFLSAGPQEKPRAPDLQDPDNFASSEPTLGAFFKGLAQNKIKHIIAVGRVTPYYPHVKETGVVNKDQVMSGDFVNYFVPNAHGPLVFKDNEGNLHKVVSVPVKKVGRITTYEISIDDSPEPVLVHHYPLPDKQPLNLTDSELHYIQSIGENDKGDAVLAHCRGGRGRSAQIAFILASAKQRYKRLNHEERLALMREDRFGFKYSPLFVETQKQVDYLRDNEHSFKPNFKFNALRPKEFRIYFLLQEMMQLELERVKTEIALSTPAANYTKEQKTYAAMLEAYNDFLFAESLEAAVAVFNKFQKNPDVVPAIRDMPLDMDSLNAEFEGNYLKALTHMSVEPKDFAYLFRYISQDHSFSDFFGLLAEVMPEYLDRKKDRDGAIETVNQVIYAVSLSTAYLQQFDILKINNSKKDAKKILEMRAEAIEEIGKLIKDTLEKLEPHIFSNTGLRGDRAYLYSRLETLSEVLLELERNVLAPENDENFQFIKDNALYLQQALGRNAMHVIKTVDQEGGVVSYRPLRPLTDAPELPFPKQASAHETMLVEIKQLLNKEDYQEQIISFLKEKLTKFYQNIPIVKNAITQLENTPLSKQDLEKRVTHLVNLFAMYAAKEWRRFEVMGANNAFYEQLHRAKEIIQSKEELVQDSELKELLQMTKSFMDAQQLLTKRLRKAFVNVDKALDSSQVNKKTLRQLVLALYEGKPLPKKIAEGMGKNASVDQLKKALLMSLVDKIDTVIDHKLQRPDTYEQTAYAAAMKATHQREISQLSDETRDRMVAKNKRQKSELVKPKSIRVPRLTERLPEPVKAMVVDETFFTQPGAHDASLLHIVLREAAFHNITLIVVINDKTNIEKLREAVSLHTPYSGQAIQIVKQPSSMEIQNASPKDAKLLLLEKVVEKHNVSKKGILYVSTTPQLEKAKQAEFRCVHFPDREGIKKMGEFALISRSQWMNYNLGFLKDMIAILSHDPEKIKKDMNPFDVTLTSRIPDFERTGFISTPIVMHCTVTNFRKWIAKVAGSSDNEESKQKLNQYLYEFMLSAVEAYPKLIKEYKTSIAMEVPQYLQEQIDLVHELLFDLKINVKNISENDLEKRLNNILTHINMLIRLDNQYYENVGETYFSNELRKLQAVCNKRLLESPDVKITFIPLAKSEDSKSELITHSKSELTLSEMEDTKSEVKTTEQAKKESQPKEQRRILFPPTFEDVSYGMRPEKRIHPGMKTNPSILQRQKETIDAQSARIEKDVKVLYEKIHLLTRTSLPENGLAGIKINDLYTKLADMTFPDLGEKNIREHYQHLMQYKLLLADIKKLSEVLGLSPPPEIEINGHRLSLLEDKENELLTKLDTVEQHPQFKAMLFLQHAEGYLLSHKMNNNVINQQLKVIRGAHETGDYVKAKSDFILLGEQRKKAPWAKEKVNNYFSLFKSKEGESVQARTERIQEAFVKKKPI